MKISQSFREFMSEYKRIFKMEMINKFNLDTMMKNIFNTGIYPDIDANENNDRYKGKT